jgi:hypothetical protein
VAVAMAIPYVFCPDAKSHWDSSTRVAGKILQGTFRPLPDMHRDFSEELDFQ